MGLSAANRPSRRRHEGGTLVKAFPRRCISGHGQHWLQSRPAFRPRGGWSCDRGAHTGHDGGHYTQQRHKEVRCSSTSRRFTVLSLAL